MARPAKKARKDARGALLRDARELILSQGYAKTSVDTINARAGLSKGTFYHYFKSKSELLDAVVDELTEEGWRSTERAIATTEGGALERFEQFLQAARRWRIIALPQTAAIMRAVFRPDNAQLRERMRHRSIDLVQPALARLLEDGNREGVFRVPDPDAAAQVFLILAYGVSEDQVREVMSSARPDEELLERIAARGRAFMRAIEALLGLPPESLEGPDTELLAAMIRAFREEDLESGRGHG